MNKSINDTYVNSLDLLRIVLITIENVTSSGGLFHGNLFPTTKSIVFASKGTV